MTSLSVPGEWREFTVWGQPKGYVRRTRKGLWHPSVKIYHQWMIEVQTIAVAAGLRLPLEASEGSEIFIRSWAVYKNRIHPDPGNVHKGIEDSLFYGSKRGDKYAGGCYGYPLYSAERPNVKVRVERVAHGNQDLVGK